MLSFISRHFAFKCGNICISEDDVDITIQTQTLLANVCIYGMFYMGFCFIKNRHEIKNIVDHVGAFSKFSDLNVKEIDRKATLYSKVFLVYSVAGMLTYSAMPFFSLEYCENNKPRSMVEHGIPCALTVRYRYPFRIDVFPWLEIFLVHQFFTGLSTTIIIVIVTMLLCGILSHVVSQLKQLRLYIAKIDTQPEIHDHSIKFAVEFHTAIIE